ncbi:MAG: YceI family protein [Lentisphaeria bacterium]|nr:YceI family protein [Lentisphaeria bacterium]
MRLFSGIAVLCTIFSAGAAERFMDFDNAGAAVPAPFELTEKYFYSPPRAMRLRLSGKPAEMMIPDFVPGKNLGVAFNYLHSPAFRSVRVEVQCLNAAGRVLRGTAASIGRWPDGWSRGEIFLPGVPEKTSALRLRFVTLKPDVAGQELVIDNLRLTSPASREEFFPDRFELPQFDRWSRRRAADEKFLPGNNAELHLNWHRSKFGEAALKCRGTGVVTSFPWRVWNIRIKPGEMYRASLFYVPEKKPVSRSVVLNIAFRDASGRTFAKPVSCTLAHAQDWKEQTVEFRPPAGAAFMDMRMCFVRAPKDQNVFFNRISIAPMGPVMTIDTKVDPAKKVLSGKLTVFGMEKMGPMTLRAEDAQHGKHTIPLATDGTFTLDLAGLPDGKVVIEASGADAEGKTHRTVKTLRNYNSRPWEGLGLGDLPCDAPPPPPWTPLTYPAERRVRTWGSEVELTPQLALSGIEAAGVRLLKAPIQLRLDGKDIFSLPSDRVTAVKTPNHAEYSTRLQGKDFRAAVTARVTFYGGVRYRIELEALRALTVGELTLGYSPVCTDYLQLMLEAFSRKCTMSLRREKSFQHDKLVPTIWCGNENAGIFSMFDKLHPAVEKQQGWCHRMLHDGEFTTKLVNTPLKLRPGEKRSFEFMLGSTPVRPPTLHRGEKLRFRAGKYSNMELMWSVPAYLPYCGFPIAPENPEPLTAFLNRNKQAGKLSFIYQIPFFIMADLPQFEYFFDAWRVRPERCYPPNTNYYPQAMYNLDVANRSWQDLYLRHLDSFLRKYPFDGLYFDGVGTYAAIERNGDFCYRTLAAEEFARRIYILQRKINRNALSFTHAGGSLLSVGTIFADIFLTGEQFRYFLEKNRYYLQFMTLDEFRLQTGSNIGPSPMFLPQYRKPLSEEKDTACHTMGLVLLHDLGLYPSFIRQDVIDNCRNRLYAFCDSARPTRFAGYWTPDRIDSGNPEVVISGYLNAAGKLLICLNKSGDTQRFPAPAGRSVEIYDPETDTTSGITPGSPIELKPYLMKMVTVR